MHIWAGKKKIKETLQRPKNKREAKIGRGLLRLVPTEALVRLLYAWREGGATPARWEHPPRPALALSASHLSTPSPGHVQAGGSVTRSTPEAGPVECLSPGKEKPRKTVLQRNGEEMCLSGCGLGGWGYLGFETRIYTMWRKNKH